MTGWSFDAAGFRMESHFGDRMVPCRRARFQSVTGLLRHAVAINPGGEALVCGDFRASWAELAALVETFAAGLAGHGISRGDRVILFMGNRAEFVIALFAIARLSAIAIPVGEREQAPGLAYIAEQSGAKAIIHETILTDRIPALTITIAVGNDMDPGNFVSSFAGAVQALPDDEPQEEEPALIMYTSGTTGKPKGAIITHLAMTHVGQSYVDCMKLTSADRSACVVPLSHITGISALLMPMTIATGTLIVIPHFNAGEFVALTAAERMTHTVLVPAMYNLFLARVDLRAHDLSAWRIGGFGGAPMPVPTIEHMAQALPKLQLMNCYGPTETAGGVAVMPASELLANSDSIGWPLPGTDILVMDDSGKELPRGEIGELWINGPTVTPGYWRNPEASAANLVAGYWRSGDLGTIDSNGFVRVLDRLKDMINRGGYKIFTAEVESVLTDHPAVLEAAVVGKACPILGERVHAFITLRDGETMPSVDELLDYCGERLSDYKRPESFDLSYTSLPRNLNGKVLKTELRKALNEAQMST
jgi:acyl-CoA synthetase (AMP-forming)/AMP-acid ligase II